MLKNEGFMRNNLVTNILLIVIAIVLILNLIPKNSPERYSMYVNNSDYRIYVIDNETGHISSYLISEIPIDSIKTKP